jgi:hypothetical protein
MPGETAMPKLANFLAFQLGWFACVLGAAWGRPWVGTGLALAIVGWHLNRAAHPRAELTLIAIAAAVGALWDSALVALGWIGYPNGILVAETAPHWMVALWMLFATTLNVSLSWLKRRLLLAVVLGAIGGPLAYLAGSRLGALSFIEPAAALAALAIGWALLTPLLVLVARRHDGLLHARDTRGQAEESHV